MVMTALRPKSHFEAKDMIWLELTNFCNLNCTHCYNESGPHEPVEVGISPARYREILAEARHMEFARVQFIGGEPLFYPHIKGLVEHATALGFEEIEIFSNLTTAPAWLVSPNFRHIKIATSFYSDNDHVHDTITQTPGSFARTVASLKKVTAAGMVVRAGYIEMGANAGHFERARAYLETLGVSDVGFDVARGFGREAQGEPSMTELCGHCSTGNLSIDVEGTVSGCIMSKPWAFGSVRDASLTDIFHSADRRRFARELKRNVEERALTRPVMCSPQTECQPLHCFPQTCAPQVCMPQRCSPAGCNPIG